MSQPLAIAAAGAPSAPPARDAHPRRWWILGALCLSMLVIGLDGTVLNVALSDISLALNATTGELQWIVNSYLLTFAVLLIPIGVLGDRLGRGRVLAAGLSLFVVASAVAAWTQTPGQLIAARAAMGIGAAAVMPLCLSIIPTVFPAHERRRAVSVLTACMGIGMPLGPLVGGWLLQHFWWGSTMLINVPVVAVALTAGLLLIPDSRSAHRRPVDFPGIVLSALGFTALVYGLVSAPNDGWTSASVLACFAAAVVLLGALVPVERRAASPLIGRELAREPMFLWPTVVVSAGSFVLLGLLFLVPQYLQAVHGLDEFETGLRLMPMMVALALGAGVAERLAARLQLKAVIAVGFGFVAAGFAPLVTLDLASGYLPVLAALVSIGFGFGVAMAPAMDAMLGALPADQESTATSINGAVKQLASALGVALLGNLVNAAYTDGLRSATTGLPTRIATIAEGSVQGASEVARSMGSSGDALRLAAHESFMTGLHHASLACIVVCILTAVAVAIGLPSTRLPEAILEEPAQESDVVAV